MPQFVPIFSLNLMDCCYRPKSAILTEGGEEGECVVRRMFSSFRSRWMILARWQLTGGDRRERQGELCERKAVGVLPCEVVV